MPRFKQIGPANCQLYLYLTAQVRKHRQSGLVIMELGRWVWDVQRKTSLKKH